MYKLAVGVAGDVRHEWVTQVGGFLGPFLWGWIAERCNKILAIQASLFLSVLSNVWLAVIGR